MTDLKDKVEIRGMERLVQTVQELSLARDINAIMKIIRSVARELTAADGAAFVLRDGDECYYADEDAISPLWKGCRFPVNVCISGWAMTNRKEVIIEDIYKDNRIPLDAYRTTFVKSLAMVPIRKVEPVGAIGVYWANQHLPTKEEVSLLQSLADVTSVSMENVEIHNELKKKLEERLEMMEQLQAQKNKLEEFTHIISHNLRAPISNLMQLNKMIENTNSMDEKLLFIEKQSPVIYSLNETFEELVNAVQIKNDTSVKKDRINLKTCLKNTLQMLNNEITEAGAHITHDLRAKTVYFPREYMDSILYNLISNSLKYCSPARTPEIRIESRKENGWVYISVEDNGLGIDMERHGEQLFKLQKTFHEHPKAKGYGLFITKNQVESMGGRIWATSIPDKGATFTIRIKDK